MQLLTQRLNPLTWLIPARCLGCARRSKEGLCQRCSYNFDQLERPQPLALQAPIKVWAWGFYRAEMQRAMHALKYDGGYPWGRIFGERLGQWWRAKVKTSKQTWHVVPIPLSAEKLQLRGYNQAEEISYTFARWTGYAHHPAWLQRSRSTEAQCHLTPEARAANLKGAFVATPEVRGKAILLVDDICTTGTTLAEAAQALLAQGAVCVEAVVVARPIFQTK